MVNLTQELLNMFKMIEFKNKNLASREGIQGKQLFLMLY